MKSKEFKSKYFDLYNFLLEKSQIETNYEELTTRSKINDYLSFILNVKKSDIKDEKYENSKFDLADTHTPIEILRVLDERYPPLKIEIMYIVHLMNNGTKNDFYLPEELNDKEKQALKNLVFLYGISAKRFKRINPDKLSDKCWKRKKLNLFDTIKLFFDDFEKENNEEMIFYNDYSSIREKTLSDKEILNAFIYFIDPHITTSDLQQFKSGFKELIFEIEELALNGFFGENPVVDWEKFYYEKAINILYEFVECLNADTIMASQKRDIRKEIDFVKNLADTLYNLDSKINYDHLPLIDQILLIAPMITLLQNYLKFLDSFAESEEDLSFIRKTGPIPKYHQYAFIQSFFNKLSQFDLKEKTKHKLIRILNLLSSLTHLLGENFEEISSYDDDNIDKILRKSI